jgi:5'-3' exonuclease
MVNDESEKAGDSKEEMMIGVWKFIDKLILIVRGIKLLILSVCLYFIIFF